MAILLCAGISPAAMSDVIQLKPDAMEDAWTAAAKQWRAPTPPHPFESALPPATPARLTLAPDLPTRFASAVYVQTLEKDSTPTDGHFSQVPEPGSFALFGAGLLGLAFIRHRRSP